MNTLLETQCLCFYYRRLTAWNSLRDLWQEDSPLAAFQKVTSGKPPGRVE